MSDHPTLRLTPNQLELIKWVAILTMVADHVDLLLLNRGLPAFNAAGRVAFPLFAFLVAYHARYSSHAPRRYIARLLGLAVASAPIHMWSTGSEQVNVLFTLALGAAGAVLWDLSRDWTRPGWQVGARALYLALVLASGFFIEYFWFGPLLILAASTWLHTGNRWLLCGCLALLLTLNFLHPLSLYALAAAPLVWGAARVTFAVPRIPRLIAYGFYPVHLAVLAML